MEPRERNLWMVDFIMDYMKEARNEPTYGVHHNKIHLILRLISLTASRHVRGWQRKSRTMEAVNGPGSGEAAEGPRLRRATDGRGTRDTRRDGPRQSPFRNTSLSLRPAGRSEPEGTSATRSVVRRERNRLRALGSLGAPWRGRGRDKNRTKWGGNGSDPT